MKTINTIKKFASYLIYTLLLATIACACSDNLDIINPTGLECYFEPSYFAINKHFITALNIDQCMTG